MELQYKLESFEGPLDLLLHLIEKNKVNIYDIPIAKITDQYMDYVSHMEEKDLDLVSEFLVMAAELLDIKARWLLPKEENEDGEEEDPRAELVEQLKQMEAPWHSYTMPYIPKGWLNRQPEELPIVNGSILALTTTMDGLDVTHVGFACWIGGELHLLHASSQKGKVILDPLTLYEYQKNKKTHTGVRVIAIL